jgi:hypothetical protein
MVLQKVTKDLNLMKCRGIIPFSYKSMGISPRILPVTYGETINSVKRITRDFVLDLTAKEARLLAKDQGIIVSFAADIFI